MKFDETIQQIVIIKRSINPNFQHHWIWTNRADAGSFKDAAIIIAENFFRKHKKYRVVQIIIYVKGSSEKMHKFCCKKNPDNSLTIDSAKCPVKRKSPVLREI